MPIVLMEKREGMNLAGIIFRLPSFSTNQFTKRQISLYNRNKSAINNNNIQNTISSVHNNSKTQVIVTILIGEIVRNLNTVISVLGKQPGTNWTMKLLMITYWFALLMAYIGNLFCLFKN